jgi:4-amino-4-deoxy-L-arabinose transferase-like glycosyltransferase
LLAAVLSFYSCIAVAHAMKTPVGFTGYQDAPDEAAHGAYVRQISIGRLPTRDKPGTFGSPPQASYEWHQPPLYYFLAAQTRLACNLVAGRFRPTGDGCVRFLSILIGLAAILTVHRAVRIVLPDRPETAALAASIAALIPGHVAITSVVNNDGLLELCFSAFLLVLFKALVNGLTLRRSIAAGCILGAALLTKSTAVLLLPVFIVALFLFRRNGETQRSVVQCAIIVICISFLISGWWFVRNGIYYHEWLPLTAFRQSFQGTAQAADVVSGRMRGLRVSGWASYAGLVAAWTFQSFFAVYSTARGSQYGVPSYLPAQLYLLSGIAALASLGGLFRDYMRRNAVYSRAQRDAFTIASVAFALVAASFAAFTLRYFQAQGRYFYPVMLPISLAGALGLQSVVPPRYSNAISLIVVAFLAVFCLAFLRVTE